ncbi:hypothetical protein HaLaN_09556 [Haematococcus lacustris]|uniref:Uncharacterized protein n=1 Tax=Haematococcus lacustris TaxID=44745 RepID=A0A699Z3L8_HAELA|nr:hypothetical protein HaLaN_09556 [Haematococcus lacustris]
MSSRRPGLQHQASSSDWDMLGQGSDSGQQLTAAHASSSLNAAGLQAGSGHALLQPSPDTVARLARHAAATQPQSWCQGSEPGGGLGGVPLSAVQEEGGPGSSSRLRALPWGPSHSLALLQASASLALCCCESCCIKPQHHYAAAGRCKLLQRGQCRLQLHSGSLDCPTCTPQMPPAFIA